MPEKPIVWVGSARDDVRAFPEDARRQAGLELQMIQRGLRPTDWKPMPDVGSGVIEIRIRIGGEHRIFYVAKYEEAVYVLHAFQKKSQKTAKHDIELGRARLAQVTSERAAQEKRKSK